ncbi:MAG TPA: hypothetical protein VGJ22_05790 [Anaerolineales bacterium]
MRTPAGKECRYFYGDYHRGRNLEECRLLEASGQRWTRDLCNTCPVPAIILANACEFLQLRGTVARPFSAAFQRRVQLSAFCDKTSRVVSEPQIGCGECHALPFEFQVKE